jgi:asparagine N-glycosylation enzyme membrane subunit Stt3
MDFVFVLFIIIFFVGHEYSILPVVLINFIILTEGLLVIKKGADRDHLGVLNYGLSIITALVICRFFDTDISFIVRGLLFVMVGAGFFSANYLLIKKRNRTHG